MPITDYQAKSLKQYLKIALELSRVWKDKKDGDIWFRGQASASWDLRPRLYRLQKPDEDEIRVDFKRVGLQLADLKPADKWDWYFLMQHHGAPTRLLDWTDGALLAIYFAVREKQYRRNEKNAKGESKKIQEDAAVYMLDPSWLNRKSVKDGAILLKDSDDAQPYLPDELTGTRLHPRYPVAIDPPHVDKRVAVQRSRFTIYGAKHHGLELLGKKYPRSRLVKVTILGDRVKRIREELETCGILETSVFPDLDGLGREVEYLWTGES